MTCLLNNIHSNFQAYGLSAVDILRLFFLDAHTGAQLFYFVSQLPILYQSLIVMSHELLGVKMSTTIGPLLLITVSMATNYGDEYSLESYHAV